jgi:hypothetical protein
MFEHPTGPRWAVCGENADQIDSRKYTRATKRDRAIELRLARLENVGPPVPTSLDDFTADELMVQLLEG